MCSLFTGNSRNISETAWRSEQAAHICRSKQYAVFGSEVVRSCSYVYQPIEGLVVLVVTTKNSNIIEDLVTLRTLAKSDSSRILTSIVVPEYAGSVREEAVVDHAFDIIFALDELITYGGMNEPISLQQVRVNLVCFECDVYRRQWRATKRSCLQWFKRAR